MASLALFLQTLVVEKLLLGNAIGDLFVGLFERGLPPEPQFSLAGALAARGDYQGAQRELERNIQAMPNDPRPLLALARLQRLELRDYAGAALTLQRILQLNKASPAIKQQAARELAELRQIT